jgi:hypothetical protein
MLVNASGDVDLLGTYPDLSAIELDINGCGEMLAQVSSSSSEKRSILEAHWNICKDSKDLIASYDKASRKLYLPQVAYRTGSVEATLIKKNDSSFAVEKHNMTESNSNFRGYCHGYFDGETLILPAVLSDGVISGMKMKFTGNPPEFRVLETYP